MNYDDWRTANWDHDLEDQIEEAERKREGEESMIDYIIMNLDD